MMSSGDLFGAYPETELMKAQRILFFKYCIQMSFFVNVGLSAVIQRVSLCPRKLSMGAVMASRELCHYSLSAKAPGSVRG